jgi:hypothetical protein
MTDPQAQADIGREVGIVRASEKREAEGKTEGE